MSVNKKFFKKNFNELSSKKLKSINLKNKIYKTKNKLMIIIIKNENLNLPCRFKKNQKQAAKIKKTTPLLCDKKSEEAKVMIIKKSFFHHPLS